MKNYRTGVYLFFDLLVYTHLDACPEMPDTDFVRLSDEEVYKYDKFIKFFLADIEDLDNIDELIRKILNFAGTLWLVQPFYDGNTRTIVRFITLVLRRFNYKINSDLNSNIIPIFYDENETCNDKKVEDLKRKLQKIN